MGSLWMWTSRNIFAIVAEKGEADRRLFYLRNSSNRRYHVKRSGKQLFLRNSSKTVVIQTTFQKTVRPDVIMGCESFTQC